MFAPPDTLCRDCIFYNNKIDCRIGRAQFYREKGIKVVRTEHGTIIKDFVCPYYRPESWLESNKDKTNLIQIIQQENLIQYIPIVLHLEGQILKDTLNKIKRFDNPPKEIYVIVRDNPDKNLKTMDLVKETLDGSGITWNTHFELEEDSWHIIFKNYNRHEFLLVINGYPEVNNKWPKVITKKIQEELLKFSYCENKKQTMMLISPYIYNAYYFEHTKKFLGMLRLERNKQKCIL
jgi:hypothetical protein